MTEPVAPPPATPPAPPPPAMPPPEPYAAPAVAVVGRPGMVTAGGIVMIVVGAILCLFGLIALLGGALIGGLASGAAGDLTGEEAAIFGALGGAFAGLFIVFAAILLGIGILDIVAGAKVLSGRTWARITGLVVAVILILFALAGLGSSDSGGVIVSVIWIAANAFIVFALATGGRWFAARTA